MALTGKLAQFLITVCLVPVLGKVKWSVSSPSAARRLRPAVSPSHEDLQDPGCIISGFDEDNPAKIYVGGPCSAIERTSQGPAPTEDFRWMEMETIYVTLANPEGSAAPFEAYEAHVHATDHDSHAEVGVSVRLSAEGFSTDYKAASLFASTTSYMSKASFSYKENTFVLGEGQEPDTYQTLDLCVVPCCADPPCDSCSECPDAYASSAEPGSFKYSILAAAFDNAEVQGYQSGASGNGWQKLQADMGKGESKTLTGSLLVYQIIDFTNMQADTLTVAGPDGEEVMYKDMEEFNGCDDTGCNAYSVENMTVESGGWTGTYSFPQTYNRGVWQAVNGEITGTTTDTKLVEINAVKFNQQTAAHLGIEGKKTIALQYKFDATGITATDRMGAYMVYDPTVSSGGAEDDFIPVVTDDETSTTELKFDDDGDGESTTSKSGDGESTTSKSITPSSTTTTTPSSSAISTITITGESTLAVENATAFVADPTAKVGVQQGLASSAGVEEAEVSVTLSVASSRRLQERKLQGTTVKVEFTITKTVSSADASATAALLADTLNTIDTSELSEAIVAAIEAAGGETYTLAVEALTAQEPVISDAVDDGSADGSSMDGNYTEEDSGAGVASAATWMLVALSSFLQ
mmetsp:Transcript_22017/g.39458  ORF Transcript_22017/g.39458 Transcript_22017/m.39458 type:complete len:635 (-) Transcript_22017:118-2022(-)